MIGPITKLLVRTAFVGHEKLFCSPYIWDSNLEIPLLSLTKYRHWTMWFNTMATCIHALVFLFRAIDVNMTETGVYADWMVPFVNAYLCIWIVAACMQIALVVDDGELSNTVAEGLRFFHRMERYKIIKTKTVIRLNRQTVINDPTGSLLLFLLTSSIPILFFLVIISFYCYDLPVYPFLIEPNASLTEILNLLKIGFNGFESSYLFCLWFANMFLYCYTGLPCAIGIFKILQELSPDRISYTTSSILRTQPNFLRHYRELQTLWNPLVRVYCQIVLPAAKFCFVLLAAYCIFLAIRAEGLVCVVTPNAVGVLVGFLVGAFVLCGQMYEESAELLRTWEFRVKGRASKKLWKSLKPLKVKVGSCYFADKGVVLVLLQSIVETTVDLLVATPP